MNKNISLQFNDLQNDWLIEKDTMVTIINNKGSITIENLELLWRVLILWIINC